jgi:hypothetical protein
MAGESGELGEFWPPRSRTGHRTGVVLNVTEAIVNGVGENEADPSPIFPSSERPPGNSSNSPNSPDGDADIEPAHTGNALAPPGADSAPHFTDAPLMATVCLVSAERDVERSRARLPASANVKLCTSGPY